jgi:predicted small lipoprotein YifL
LVVLTVATLALAGCGRKAGLDRPPNASTQSSATNTADEADQEPAKGSLFDPSYGVNRDPAASRGQKKSFILDPLLNN